MLTINKEALLELNPESETWKALCKILENNPNFKKRFWTANKYCEEAYDLQYAIILFLEENEPRYAFYNPAKPLGSGVQSLVFKIEFCCNLQGQLIPLDIPLVAKAIKDLASNAIEKMIHEKNCTPSNFFMKSPVLDKKSPLQFLIMRHF